jgi:hypothetical protein
VDSRILASTTSAAASTSGHRGDVSCHFVERSGETVIKFAGALTTLADPVVGIKPASPNIFW